MWGVGKELKQGLNQDLEVSEVQGEIVRGGGEEV